MLQKNPTNSFKEYLNGEISSGYINTVLTHLVTLRNFKFCRHFLYLFLVFISVFIDSIVCAFLCDLFFGENVLLLLLLFLFRTRREKKKEKKKIPAKYNYYTYVLILYRFVIWYFYQRKFICCSKECDVWKSWKLMNEMKQRCIFELLYISSVNAFRTWILLHISMSLYFQNSFKIDCIQLYIIMV